jgi:hypothetical protein
VQVTAAGHVIKTDCGVGVAAGSNTCCHMLWLVILRVRVAILCPEECQCDIAGYYVTCLGYSLNNIPLILPTNAQELLLYSKSTTSLEKDSFISRGLTELEKLNVRSLALETIELGALNGLTKLTHLAISRSEITDIIPGTFQQSAISLLQ